MEEGDGVRSTTFKITLNKSFYKPDDLLVDKYVIYGDIEEVKKPKNFWHEVLSKLKMPYSTKTVGWQYTVKLLSEIENE